MTLISDHNPNIKSKFISLVDENRQLILIISKIIINAKKKKN